jgi:methyl-accepting chemotaxis protein
MTAPRRLWSDLSIRHKLAVIGVAAALAVLIPTLFYVRSLQVTVGVSEQELRGIAPLRETFSLLHGAQRFRDGSVSVAANGQGAGDRDAAAAQVDAAIASLEALLPERSGFTRSNAALAAVKADWADMRAKAPGLDAKGLLERDAQSAAVQFALLDALRDESAYVYTPYVDAYHLMYAGLVVGPNVGENIAILRARGVIAVGEHGANGDVPATPVPVPDLLSIAGDLQVARTSATTFRGELAKSIAMLGDTGTPIAARARDAQTAIDAALAMGMEGLLVPGQPNVDAASWVAKTTAAVDAQYALQLAILDGLQTLSQAHLESARRQFIGTVIALAVLILGVGYFSWRISSQLVSTLRYGVVLSGRIADGTLDNRIHIERNDEGGQLLAGLKRMQEQLDASLTHEREAAAENARIRSALDVASAGVMIADASNIIVYVNPAVQAALLDVEDEIRTHLPAFRARELLGRPFDLFHARPDHQRRVVEALAGTHRARIQVGRRHFELAANPIVDADGQRVGTVLEWIDRTADTELQEELRRVVAAASAGELDVRLHADGGDPRFAQIAGSINAMLEATSAAAAEVQLAMSALSTGDLGYRAEAQLAGAFGQLLEDSNRTAGELADVVGRIQQAAGSITEAAAEIAAGNDDLSRRTEQQAASLEETVASLEELTSTVRATADNARRAAERSQHSERVAAEGGRAMADVVKTMEGIEQVSRRVADITSTIDGIAFQTNILALNAAVEAARAGDQGRGFAVVAGEVRALAQRSAQAAKEISALIGESVAQVAHGSEQVHAAGGTIEGIIASAREVAAIVADISAATLEQARGIEQVNQTVTVMDEVTQQNAALVEEASAAAASMAEQARAMQEVVSVFRLTSSGAPSGEAAGINLDAMIRGHQAWKQRLFDHIAGRGERLDAATAARDDACALGHWIHGDGGTRFARLPELVALRASHAAFHACAGGVVRCTDEGRKADAEALVAGEFVQQTTQTVAAIRALGRALQRA